MGLSTPVSGSLSWEHATVSGPSFLQLWIPLEKVGFIRKNWTTTQDRIQRKSESKAVLIWTPSWQLTQSTPAGQHGLFGSLRKWGPFPYVWVPQTNGKYPREVPQALGECSCTSEPFPILTEAYFHRSFVQRSELSLLELKMTFTPTVFVGYPSKIYFILSSLLKSHNLIWKS